MNKKKIIFWLLIILGIILRITFLGKFASGFFRDEAAIGYNAYSIWLTGKDEYGVLFPTVFRSFEVFFLPLYIYLSAPIVGLLGLSEFSVRLLSCVSGITTLFLIYYIAKEIWDVKIARFSLFVLALAPWHILYSRGTFEGNLALTLFAAGFLFLLKYIKKQSSTIFFASVFFFAMSMYSYQAERLVVPLLGVATLVFVGQKFWSNRQKILLPSIVVILILIPLLLLSFKPGGYHRAFGVSVFSKEVNPPGWIENEPSSLLTNNKTYLKTRQIASLYLSYFSPRNLFIEGDSNHQRSTENYSMFYSWMTPFLLLGFWTIFKKKRSINKKLFLSWVFISPLPAALTGDPFHTYRSLLLYLPLSILIGLGISRTYELIKKYKNVFLSAIVLVSLASVMLFLFDYFVLTQATRARDWDYGYKEIVEYANSLPADTKIVVDDPWTEAYIHFLFFSETNPRTYHEEVGNITEVESYYYTSSDEIRPNRLGTYEFRDVEWPLERGDTGVVFVMQADRLPESEFITDPRVKLLKEIKYPDGIIAYRIVEILAP